MNAVAAAATDQLHVWLQQALAYQRAGQPVEASQYYLLAIRAQPNYWKAYYNLGVTFQAMNQLAEARNAYQRVVQLNPDFAEAHNNLGNVLRALKDDNAAEAAYQRALALKPSLAEASYNMALIEQAKGRFSESVLLLKNAVAGNPEKDDAWDALYRAQLGLKRQEGAIQTFLAWEAAIGASPLLTAAGLAQSRFLADRVREEKYLALAIDWPFAQAKPGELQPVLGMLQYFDLAPTQLLKCYRRYDAAVAATMPVPAPRLPRRSAGAKIRVGYVSADFRRHVMGRIMADVFAAHDRSRFEVTFISLCEKLYQDEVTQAFARDCDHFLDIATLTDQEAAAVIAELDLDILVDLAGHTMAARPTLYAHRPARRIVTHLGYHGGLGLSAVDYKVTDAIADPPPMAQYQIEKLLYLDSCLFPFTHTASVKDADARHLANKPVGKFLFGVFVNVMKLSPRCLDAWRQIIERVPQAMLAFSPLHPDDVPSIERALQSATIPLSRLHIIPATKADIDTRGRYAAIDAVLDTFPYTGGDTTLAALDRDVPVVTLCGQRNAERVGASLLTHLGLTDMIATTEAAYVEIACRLVNEPRFRADAAAAIRHARAHAPAAAAGAHTGALERAYSSVFAETAADQADLSAATFHARFRDAIAAPTEEKFTALLQDQPGHVPLLQARAQFWHRIGDTTRAIEDLTSVLAQRPHDADTLLAYGNLLVSRGVVPEQALRPLLALIAALPSTKKSHAAMARLHARALMALGRFADAAEALAAIAAPLANDIETHFVHANVLANLDRADEAIALYQRVLLLDPGHAPACVNAARLMSDRGEWVAAEALLKRAIEAQPDEEAAYHQLADVLRHEGKWTALVSLGRVMARFPTSLQAALVVAECARFEGDLGQETARLTALARAVTALDGQHDLVERLGHAILARLPALEIDTVIADRLIARYLEALHALYKHAPTRPRAHASTGARRIGVLVCALADPSVKEATARVLASIAGEHDHLFVYALDAVPPDALDALLKSSAAQTSGVVLAGVGQDNAANRMNADALDVLIDLSGSRHPAALPLLVQHPAAITLSNGALALHVGTARGYLPDDLDFELFDTGTALPSWRSRGPARPMMAWHALLPRASPQTSLGTRSDLAEVFVYALPTPISRVSRATLQLARAILDRDARFRLAVTARDEATLQIWQRVGQSLGIAAEKILPLPRELEGSLRFQHADALLDPRPASDAVAVCEALALGLPVITMKGPTADERMGYAILTAVGLDALVAESGPDYINLATKLATDASWRATIRAQLARAAATPVPAQVNVAALDTALKNLSARAITT